MAKSQEWKVNSTTIENGRIKVSGAAKYVTDGSNKFTTFSKDNFSGRIPLDESSSNRIVSTTFYSIDSDGYIDFYRRGPNGNFKKYKSIQEIADAGIVGYNSTTTNLLKSKLSGKLDKKADEVKISGPANPNATVDNDGNTSNDGDDDDEGGSSTPIPDTLFTLTIRADEENTPSGRLRYPENIGSLTTSNLDRIKFVQGEYAGVSLGRNGGGLTGSALSDRQFKMYTDSSVVIGIQPTISDSNQVRWNGGNLDQIKAFAARTSLDIIKSDGVMAAGQKLGEAAKQVIDEVGSDSNIGKALNTLFAGKAVGVGGQLQSRVSGAVLNPNLELLFEGPTLRSFNYTFKMSAENKGEATQIKRIIKWFKKGMAIKKASGNLFLSAPNIFSIKYIKGEDSVTSNPDHDAINKIKKCALLDMKVNYTPEGNYSTYSDGTMSMYEMSLSFGELNPIYAEDYKDNHPIGY